MAERAFTFTCGAARLPAVLHQATGARGVLIVVGGPQYRVGSHRQFVLLARALAAAGVPVLRFDARGMGDAEGEWPGFEAIGPDIRAAVDAFMHVCPGLREVVLWGLCDGASASALYAPSDPRVRGLVLLNPWVREEGSGARARLSGYYLQRLCSIAFWRDLLRGRVRVTRSARELAGAAHAALREAPAPLAQRVRRALEDFPGRLLFILSGKDLTAATFEQTVAADPAWQRLLAAPRVRSERLVEANHTFSSAAWRAQVEAWTRAWVAAP